MKLLISFSDVRELLMQAGLRKREAETLLARNQPPPIAHTLHSRRRWQSQVVVDFAQRVRQGEIDLGKGACDAVANRESTPHVRTR